MRSALFPIALILVVVLVILDGAQGFVRGGGAGDMPEQPQPDQCDPNWQTLNVQLKRNRAAWNQYSKSMKCYTMVFARQCFCPPEWRGPFDATVDGRVVYPKRFSIPTMDEIFDMVQERCIDGCPKRGAVLCNVKFASEDEGSYIKSLYIDQIKQIADEEIGYTIDDLKPCVE